MKLCKKISALMSKEHICQAVSKPTPRPTKLKNFSSHSSVKVTVWCGVTSERVIGPFFFEDANENAVTVIAERYRDMLVNFVQPQLANMPGYWWQQDGATAHTA